MSGHSFLVEQPNKRADEGQVADIAEPVSFRHATIIGVQSVLSWNIHLSGTGPSGHRQTLVAPAVLPGVYLPLKGPRPAARLSVTNQ